MGEMLAVLYAHRSLPIDNAGPSVCGVASLFQPGSFKDRRQRSAASVRSVYAPPWRSCTMNPRIAIDCIVRENADRSVVDAGRGAEQDHPVLRIELRRRLCHRLLSPPALGERAI